MPNFDTIAEWVLDNLYLAGGATGAVLLILLLVLLLILRAKRGSKESAISAAFAGGPQPAGEMDLQTPLTDRTDSPLADRPDYGAPDETPWEAGPHTTSPPPPISFPPPAAAPFRPTPGAGDEHVLSVVRGLLDGQGEFTGSELRRIELLRPEKVLAALDQVEGTLTGRGKEAERSRLAKLRQYAGLHVAGLDSATAGAEAGPAPENDDQVGAAAASVGVTDTPGMIPAALGTQAIWASNALADGQRVVLEGEAPTEPFAAPLAVPVAPWPTGEEAPDLMIDRELSIGPGEEDAVTPDTPARAAATTGWVREGSADWLPGAIPAVQAPGRPGSVPTPPPVIGEAVWTAPEVPAEEPAVWTVPEIPAEEREAATDSETFLDERVVAEEESWEEHAAVPDIEEASEMAADTADAPVAADAQVAADTPSAAAAPSADDAPVPETAPEPPAAPALGPLDLRLETAEDVLALDVAEQEDALAFLGPKELGRLFKVVQDTRLKYSIVDLLTREPDSDSIEALQDCLDDPDPQIQLYALQAAERMLGSD